MKELLQMDRTVGDCQYSDSLCFVLKLLITEIHYLWMDCGWTAVCAQYLIVVLLNVTLFISMLLLLAVHCIIPVL